MATFKQAKLKELLNSIYGAKPAERKETQEMKFGIGDHVKIKESVARSEDLYPHARTGKIIAVNRFTNGRVYYIKHDGSDACSGWKESELELVGSYKGPAEFTKANLKDGMVVVTGENYDFKYFIHNDSLIQKDNWVTLDKYNDDLKYKDRDYDYMDIQAVYRSTAYTFEDMFNDRFLELIWERKPKYKVGDRVKMRDNLATGKFIISCVSPRMAKVAGKIVTISSITNTHCYFVEGSGYVYSEDMIEGLVDYEEMTVAEIEKKLGYKVKIVDGE